jgi:hypothetical protein
MLYLFYQDQEVKPTGKWAIKQQYYTWQEHKGTWRRPILYKGAYRPILLLEVRGACPDWVSENELAILPGGSCSEI